MTIITRRRGDTYPDVITVQTTSTGTAVDVTGASFTLTLDTLKAPADALTNVYSLTGTIVSAPNGTVSFAPSAIQADQLGTFYYDIQMVDASGFKHTIGLDKYVYTQDITKS